MKVLVFFCVWLENACTRPKIWVLGGFDPVVGSNINETAKGTNSCEKMLFKPLNITVSPKL